MMGKISHDLVWEENYLQKVLDFIKIQLSAREEKNLQDKKNLVASRKDMWENTSSSSSDFDRAIELTQYLQPLMLDTSSLLSNMDKIQAVSYTHLDVYKRQTGYPFALPLERDLSCKTWGCSVQ